MVKAALFPDKDGEQLRKKRRLSSPLSTENAPQVDEHSAESAADAPVDLDTKLPSVYIHTNSETFLIYPQPGVLSSDDKENVAQGANSAPTARSSSEVNCRYAIALVSRTPAGQHKDAKTDSNTTMAVEDVQGPAGSPAAITTTSTTSPAISAARATSASKEQADDGDVDMSISPSGSSKSSVNGDASKVDAADSADAAKKDAAPDQESAEKETPGPAKDFTAASSPKASLETSEGVQKDGVASEDKPAPTETVKLIAEQDTKEAAPVPSSADAEKSTVPNGAALSVSTKDKPVRKPVREKTLSLQVLQRNLVSSQFVFDTDGIGIVSEEVENNARKGWKIEAKSWRLAGHSETKALVEAALNVL